MEIVYQTPKKHYILIAITSIWVLFSSIYIIHATNQSKVYDALQNNTHKHSTHTTQQAENIKKTIKASQLTNAQDYESALQLISGNKSQDYYNRGTIQTLLAYQKALDSSISWLETAQIFLAQAQKSFELAQQLGPTSEIRKAINKNNITNQEISLVVDIKTCYGIGQWILDTINDIRGTIYTIQSTLKEAKNEINKASTYLNSQCYQKLQYITDTSIEQVNMLQIHIDNNQQTHKKSFIQKIEDPQNCLHTPYQNIIPSLTKGDEWLTTYQQQHQNTIDTLKSRNIQSINELCNETKNDAQINQNIENAVQEMLEKLEETEYQKLQHTHSNEINYKDFFTENEKKVLDTIQNINKWRIENTLKTRGKGNYEPQRYINNLFNEFYGNSGDFIDLRK